MSIGQADSRSGVSPSAPLIWFLNTLVRVRVASSEGSDAVSILEHYAPFADSPPLHIHQTEDEIFHILDGDFRVRLRDEVNTFGPGAFILAPRGTPHTYRVESRSGGRWLTVTAHGDFEKFVRALGRSAEREELPTPAGPPTPEAMQQLGTVARQFGIELVGPPLG
jgi:quercetin dioxygenase-like cupin family protein